MENENEPQTQSQRRRQHRRRRPPPLQLERAGAPGPPPGEVAAQWAHIASLIERLRGLWARVQGLDQMLRSFFGWPRNASTELVVPAAAAEGLPRGRPHHHAFFHKRQRPRRPAAPAARQRTPSPPLSPLVVVNGVSVPRYVTGYYKEYCMYRATCAERVTLCHVCFFEGKNWDTCKFSNSEAIIHNSKHKGNLLPCEARNCQVKVGSSRELELHTHFCHTLSEGWWRRKK